MKVVDFPAPFGPSKPNIYPDYTPNDVPLSAWKPFAYTFDNLRLMTLSWQFGYYTLYAS